jgi:septum site-determining protein MinC
LIECFRFSFSQTTMSKIAIISRPDHGVLIDVSGCSTMQEAVEQLSSTLQVSSQFWKGLSIDLSLGHLILTNEQLAKLLAISKGLGVIPREVFSENGTTIAALNELGVKIGNGVPMTLWAAGPLDSQAAPAKEAVPSSPAGDTTYGQEIDTTGGRIIMYENEDATKPSGDDDQPLACSSEATGISAYIDGLSTASPDSVLYLKQTLRSGQAVSHKGHLVIIGDVNAGAEVVAEGDITVWGSLRGVAHAGIGGNSQAEIRALKLQPIQIRIADSIARSPDPPRANQSTGWGPESARLVDGKIRILRNTLD